MGNLFLYSYFLYFPEDKSLYIPAIIEMFCLIVLCFIVFFIVKKISKKQEMKTKDLENRILNERKQNNQNEAMTK